MDKEIERKPENLSKLEANDELSLETQEALMAVCQNSSLSLKLVEKESAHPQSSQKRMKLKRKLSEVELVPNLLFKAKSVIAPSPKISNRTSSSNMGIGLAPDLHDFKTERLLKHTLRKVPPLVPASSVIMRQLVSNASKLEKLRGKEEEEKVTPLPSNVCNMVISHVSANDVKMFENSTMCTLERIDNPNQMPAEQIVNDEKFVKPNYGLLQTTRLATENLRIVDNKCDNDVIVKTEKKNDPQFSDKFKDVFINESANSTTSNSPDTTTDVRVKRKTSWSKFRKAARFELQVKPIDVKLKLKRSDSMDDSKSLRTSSCDRFTRRTLKKKNNEGGKRLVTEEIKNARVSTQSNNKKINFARMLTRPSRTLANLGKLTKIELKFRCIICEERFDDKYEFHRHATLSHPGVRIIFCELCNSTFLTDEQHKQHRFSYHKIIVPNCDKDYTIIESSAVAEHEICDSTKVTRKKSTSRSNTEFDSGKIESNFWIRRKKSQVASSSMNTKSFKRSLQRGDVKNENLKEGKNGSKKSNRNYVETDVLRFGNAAIKKKFKNAEIRTLIVSLTRLKDSALERYWKKLGKSRVKNSRTKLNETGDSFVNTRSSVPTKMYETRQSSRISAQVDETVKSNSKKKSSVRKIDEKSSDAVSRESEGSSLDSSTILPRIRTRSQKNEETLSSVESDDFTSTKSKRKSKNKKIISTDEDIDLKNVASENSEVVRRHRTVRRLVSSSSITGDSIMENSRKKNNSDSFSNKQENIPRSKKAFSILKNAKSKRDEDQSWKKNERQTGTSRYLLRINLVEKESTKSENERKVEDSPPTNVATSDNESGNLKNSRVENQADDRREITYENANNRVTDEKEKLKVDSKDGEEVIKSENSEDKNHERQVSTGNCFEKQLKEIIDNEDRESDECRKKFEGKMKDCEVEGNEQMEQEEESAGKPIDNENKKVENCKSVDVECSESKSNREKIKSKTIDEKSKDANEGTIRMIEILQNNDEKSSKRVNRNSIGEEAWIHKKIKSQERCINCEKLFVMMKNISAKRIDEKSSASPLRCPLCERYFISLFHLKLHVATNHLPCKNEYSCGNSQRSVSENTSENLELDCRAEIELTIGCPRCTNKFWTMKELNDHIITNHMNLCWTEKSSNGTPDYSNDLRATLLQLTTENIAKNKHRYVRIQIENKLDDFSGMEKTGSSLKTTLECPLCGAEFSRIHNYVGHLKTIHNSRSSFVQRETNSVRASSESTSFLFRDETVEKTFDVSEIYEDREEHQVKRLTSDSEQEADSTKRSSPNGQSRRAANIISKLTKERIVESSRDNTVVGYVSSFHNCQVCQKKFKRAQDLLIHGLEHVEDDSKINNEHAHGTNGSSPRVRLEPTQNVRGRENEEKRAEFEASSVRNPKTETMKEFIETEKGLNVGGMSKESSVVTCQKCNRHFANRSLLNEHLFFLHDDNLKDTVLTDVLERADGSRKSSQQWQCKECRHTFKLFQGYSRHRFFVHEDDSMVHICENCLKVLSTVTTVNVHICTNVTSYQCQRCNETFPTGISLRLHNSEKHEETEGPHTCIPCSRSFLTNAMLERHRRSVHRFVKYYPGKRDHRTKAATTKETVLVEPTRNNEIKRSDSLSLDQQSNKFVKGSNQSSDDDKKRIVSPPIPKETSVFKSPGNRKRGRPRKDVSPVKRPDRLSEKENVCAIEKSILYVDETEIHQCGVCQLYCLSELALQIHVAQIHSMSNEVCQLCQQMYPAGKLLRHVIENHASADEGSAIDSEPSWKIGADCNEMDTEILTKMLGIDRLVSLSEYRKYADDTDRKSYQCSHCDKSFSSDELYRYHFLLQHDVMCVLCNIEFKKGQDCARHKGEVHGSYGRYIWFADRVISALSAAKNFRKLTDQILVEILTRDEKMDVRNDEEGVKESSSTDKGPSSTAGEDKEDSSTFIKRVSTVSEKLAKKDSNKPDDVNIVLVVTDDDLEKFNIATRCPNIWGLSAKISSTHDEITPSQVKEMLAHHFERKEDF